MEQEVKKYTSDELMIAFFKFTNNNYYTRPAFILFFHIFALYRLDKDASGNSGVKFTSNFMCTSMNTDNHGLGSALQFLVENKIITVVQRQQNNYTINKVIFGDYIVKSIENYKSFYMDKTAEAHIQFVDEFPEKLAEVTLITQNNYTEAEQQIITKLDNSWTKFLRIRNASEKKINKTTQGYQLLLKRLMLYSNNDIEHARQILDYSIEMGYDNIYKREKEEYQSNEVITHNVPLKPLKNGKE